MPTPKKPARLSPAERQAARAAKQEAREALRAERQNEARIRHTARRLERAGAGRGVKVRLLAGIDEEMIARDIAEHGDQILDFDAWLNGPVGEPVGDLIERWDGPALYEAALLLIRAVKAALVRAGKLAA